MKELTGNTDLLRPIEDLHFSARTFNALSGHVDYVGQLVTRTDFELSRYRNLGKKSLSEIKEKLATMGLTTDMFSSTSIDNTVHGSHRTNRMDNILKSTFLIAADAEKPTAPLFASVTPTKQIAFEY